MTTKTTKIRVLSGITGNAGKMQFAGILPMAAEPWYSMGDGSTLLEIGAVLDALPPGGSDEPQWDAARKISEIFREYTRPEGAYAAEYNRSPSGHYSPGHCHATSVYDGRYNKWQFHLKMVAAVGRTVEVFIGLNGAGYETRDLIVDFKWPSESSAGDVRHNLNQLGLYFETDEVQEQDAYEAA